MVFGRGSNTRSPNALYAWKAVPAERAIFHPRSCIACKGASSSSARRGQDMRGSVCLGSSVLSLSVLPKPMAPASGRTPGF